MKHRRHSEFDDNTSSLLVAALATVVGMQVIIGMLGGWFAVLCSVIGMACLWLAYVAWDVREDAKEQARLHAWEACRPDPWPGSDYDFDEYEFVCHREDMADG